MEKKISQMGYAYFKPYPGEVPDCLKCRYWSERKGECIRKDYVKDCFIPAKAKK